MPPDDPARMRILIYTQWCTPEPAFKSVPFARELRRRGHDVRILTGFPNYPGGRLYPGYRVRAWQREVIDGVPVLRMPLYPSHDSSSVQRVLNYLSFAAGSAPAVWLGWRPDVIYVYNLVTLGLVGAVNRAIRGVPFVLDVQDLWPESILQTGMGAGWMVGPVEWMCRRAYRGAARVVVLSEGFRRNLVARGVPEEKVQVIHNWCDESAWTAPPDPTVTRTSLGFEGAFNILFAGNMGRAQALDAVVDAAASDAARNARLRFVFMGTGVEADGLRRRAASIAPDTTLFLPARPLREALAVQRLADASLIHLRDQELFRITVPSKTQAALAMGRPILAGVRGDASELVLRAGAGIACEPEQPGSILEGALRLAGMPAADREAMGARGAAFYQDHLSFDRGIRRFEALFQEVGTPPTPGRDGVRRIP